MQYEQCGSLWILLSSPSWKESELQSHQIWVQNLLHHFLAKNLTAGYGSTPGLRILIYKTGRIIFSLSQMLLPLLYHF